MIKMVVFDMAGTTVDEQNVVYKTVLRAIQRAGFSTTLDIVLFHAAGKEKYQAIHDVLEYLKGEPPEEELARDIFEDFEMLLQSAYSYLSPSPMPGSNMVFNELRAKGIKIVLNTGYNRTVAEELLEKLNWKQGHQFDLLVTATDVQRGRPHPDMIVKAMQHFGLGDAKEVAKIGDSIVDIEEGLHAGCGISAGITTGAQSRDQLLLANPTHVFDHLDEILPLC
jgi:phosphonatase-like hydrolase